MFSHLDERRQSAWLPELSRVLRPGGLLILSTHGDPAYEANRSTLPSESVREYESHGYTHIVNIMDGVLPTWYQTTFQNETHVRRTFGEVFGVVRHDPSGLVGQDLVVCEKPSESGGHRSDDVAERVMEKGPTAPQ